MQLIAAGLWPLQPIPKYIEDVFSTYLYTGNGTSQTITNGINLSGNGGLVWTKGRSNAYDNTLVDTVRGVSRSLVSNASSAQDYSPGGYVTAFNSNGFSVGEGTGSNGSGATYVSWTFREQPKFFDIVTYTGNQTAGRTVAHNLGSVPGFIACKRIDTPDEWFCYHRSLGPSQQILLNSDAAAGTNNNQWSNTAPTSSVFSLGTDSGANGTGGTYVAYLFAHDAGGFGLSGTDNVITCGSYTGNGSLTGPVITLGYEPQLVLLKRSSGIREWFILDTTRGLTTAGNINGLCPQSTVAEFSAGSFLAPTSTGFQLKTSSVDMNGSGSTYIYIAIRRGPMQVPTVGTSVFSPITSNASTGTTNTTGFPVDLQINAERNAVHATPVVDRLRGVITTPTDATSPYLRSDTSVGENPETITRYWNNTGFETSAYQAGASNVYWNFRRAPSFFDEVCYTGTGSSMTISHNLGVSPELIIGKSRSAAGDWDVSVFLAGFTDGVTSGYLNATNAFAQGNGDSFFDPVSSTTFTYNPNTSARTYVAYLFATCAGVSKVGSYTGTGAAQTINCGFTSGSRFVLIKRTDSTGDWYVWDSARGIIPSNDPYLLINSTAAEVTGTDYIDTTSVGFDITSTAPAAINANGGTFIFLAIA
jgi:hypothetical protein